MARRGPVGDHHKRPVDNEQRLAALRIRLQETAREIRTAEDWSRCLRAAARLPGESWANILLIASRIPEATMVKGYEAWHAAGRQVNRNEKGIFGVTPAELIATRAESIPARRRAASGGKGDGVTDLNALRPARARLRPGS